MTQIQGSAIKKNVNHCNVNDIHHYYYIDKKGRIDPDDIINIDDKIKEDITCSICTFVYNNTVMLECGHIFCVDCVQNIKNNRCPLCRGYYTKTHTIKEFDKIIYSKIDKLLMNCIDCEKKHTVQENCIKENCRIKRCKFCNYKVDDILEHFNKGCEYIVKCKYDICYAYGYKKTIHEHEKKCGHRYISCDTCDDKIKIKNIKKHKKKCIKTKKCEICSKRIKCSNMDNHINKKCTKRLVECNICKTKVPAHKFRYHRKKCNKYIYCSNLYNETYIYNDNYYDNNSKN